MGTGKDEGRDVFEACWDPRKPTLGVAVIAAASLFLLTGAAPSSFPPGHLGPLGVLSTMAVGAGALTASVVHAWGLPRARRAALLGLSVPVVAWVASQAAGLPSVAQGAGVAGLWCLGIALAPSRPGSLALGLSRAGVCVLLAVILDGAAAGWGLFAGAPPWPPGVAAWLLDVSPRTFAMEIAGYDWMRDPSVYESVGTDRISPSMRSAYGRSGVLGLPTDSRWVSAVAVLPLLVVGSIVTGLRLFRSQPPVSSH